MILFHVGSSTSESGASPLPSFFRPNTEKRLVLAYYPKPMLRRLGSPPHCRIARELAQCMSSDVRLVRPSCETKTKREHRTSIRGRLCFCTFRLETDNFPSRFPSPSLFAIDYHCAQQRVKSGEDSGPVWATGTDARDSTPPPRT